MLLQILTMNTLFNWHNQWYPIAIQKFTDRTKPFKTIVLDTPIVTWYDKNTEYWNTVIDRCPHRGAPLSEGRLQNGNIQCPYHGYQFNACGDCVHIPQSNKNNDKNFLSKMNTCCKITTVSEDIIWIWMNSSSFPTKDPPRYIKSKEQAKSYFIEDYMTSVPFDFRYLQENIMDVSHTAFTHHATQSHRSFATPIEYKIKSKINKNGFSMISRNIPDTEFSRYNKFIAPSYHVTSIKRKIFGISFNNTLVTYALPISQGYSQVISRFIIEGLPKIFLIIINIIPTWYRHLKVNEFVEDDIIMINRMQEYNKQNNKYRILVDSDTPVVIWNKWLKIFTNYSTLLKSNINSFTYKNNLQLLDRYERHTKHCIVCLHAKDRLKIYKRIFNVLLIIFLLQRNLILSFLTLQIIFILQNFIKRFDTGTYPPKRNFH